MIVDAMKHIKDRKGASHQAITNYVVSNNKVEPHVKKVYYHLREALKRGVKFGLFTKQSTGLRYMLTDKGKTKGKPKRKPAAKKLKGVIEKKSVKKTTKAKPKSSPKKATTGKAKSPKKAKSQKEPSPCCKCQCHAVATSLSEKKEAAKKKGALKK